MRSLYNITMEGILSSWIRLFEFSFFQIIEWSIVIMTDITVSTSVAELVAAGHIKSLEHLKALLSKANRKPGSLDPEVEKVVVLVEEKINGASDSIRWKTGTLNLALFGLFSGSGCETHEAERKMRHRQIGQALKFLSESGRLVKNSAKNACHTSYSKIKTPDPVPETPETPETPEVKTPETVTVEEAKPKARVRRKK